MPLFTFDYIRQQFEIVKSLGYVFATCEEFVALKKKGLPQKLVVNRVDIDLSVKKSERLLDIFGALDIKATFFLRLHAPEYNPFSFENYRIIKRMIRDGHELGYHSEVIDEAVIWGEDAAQCLTKDIDVINRIFEVTIKGVASHGGMTGLNNLDFWQDKAPSDFKLLYEGYDKQPAFNLFQEALYVSDSEWVRWKCYDKGVLSAGDTRGLAEHAAEGPPLIYSLIHPDTYFDHHFYDSER
jgi:hypothetical protein